MYQAMVTDPLFERLNPRKKSRFTTNKTNKSFITQCNTSMLDCAINIYKARGENKSYFNLFNEILTEQLKRTGRNDIPADGNDIDKFCSLANKYTNRSYLEFLETTSYILFKTCKRENSTDSEAYQVYEDEINHYLKKHNIGFRLNNGKFIISEEELMMDIVISPCFDCLAHNGFTIADELLYQSFEDYNCENFENSVKNAACALESLVDEILEREKIKQSEKSNNFHGKIISLIQQGILPEYTKKQDVESLIQLIHYPLKIRNSESGVAHGTSKPPNTDEVTAMFTINMIASDIIYICRKYEIYKN